MFYSYFGPSAPAEDGAVAVVMVIYLIMMLFSSVFGILSYVLTSLGSYTIANRRGIKHAWLAWIPVGSSWILGCISDQYQQVVKGKNKRKRTALLTMEIILYVMLFMFMGSMFSMMFQMISYGDMLTDQQALEMMGSMSSMLLVSFAMSGIAIAYTIVYYFALYDLYNSSRPESSVLYLVLSILIGVVTPFLIFACRNKDLGMAAPRPRYQPTYQPQSYDQMPAGQPPVYGQQPPVYDRQPGTPTWQSVQNPTYQPQPYQPPVQPQQPQYQPPQPAEPWEQQDQQ